MIDLRKDNFTPTKFDPEIQHAISVIEDTYGDNVSVDAKKKDLRKWGENLFVGTSGATIMTLGTGQTQETYVNTNSIVSVISSSASDTQNLVLHEGHTVSGSDLTFFADTTTQALTGQTAVTLNTAGARNTRARLSSPAIGDIYFYEGGATTNGVPNNLSKVHLIIPAGELQSQKCSTSISSSDYWIITGGTASVLEKSAAWAQFRIEIKPFASTYFYPVTQWVGVADSSGTVSLLNPEDPLLIVPKNYDVRVFAKASSANTHCASGIIGYLAKVI